MPRNSSNVECFYQWQFVRWLFERRELRMCGFYMRKHYAWQNSPFLAFPVHFETATLKFPYPQTAYSLWNLLAKFLLKKNQTLTQDCLSIICWKSCHMDCLSGFRKVKFKLNILFCVLCMKCARGVLMWASVVSVVKL